MNNNKFINGPINSLRLEGKINNINKVLYLFGDIHIPHSKQTKCNMRNNQDFLDYFKKNIKSNNSIKYDLFFELGPKYNYLVIPEENQKHIDKVAQFFKNSINIVNGKNKGSIDNTNLRLHYVDFRDIFKLSFNKILHQIYIIINTSICKKNINNNDLQELKKLFILLQKDFLSTLDILINNKQKTKNDNTQFIKHVIDKIKTKYKNNDIKDKILNSFVIKEINKLYNEFNKTIDQIINFIDEQKLDDNILNIDLDKNLDISYKLFKLYNKIDKTSFKIYSYIIDIYFLRRFLDKEYITNGIVYMGIYHITFYCYILVKYFDFKITHIANDTISIKKLENKINKEKFNDNLDKLLMDKKLNQCSNLSLFPENFQ